MAKENPFYAQVWNLQHSPDEDYVIPMKFSAYVHGSQFPGSMYAGLD